VLQVTATSKIKSCAISRRELGAEKMEGSVATDVREHDTPLIDAVRHGRVADVAALLADGADVNEPKTDGSGVTALYIACYHGHTEAVTTLLAANASVDRACR
jgi:ankyrin repeat protein